MNLKELQNAVEHLVFVDETIIRPAVIELADGKFELNHQIYLDAWQLAFRVTLVRREPREQFETSLGTVNTHVVDIDDIRTIEFVGPYFNFRSATVIDNAKMLAWCRHRVWTSDITTQLNTDSKQTAPVIKL